MSVAVDPPRGRHPERAATPVYLRPAVVAASLVVVALAYYMWFGVALRTINNGDGISILAAQGVLEHGYQRTPSGLIYGRGFLFHYLVAGSVAVFGLSNFAIMVPALLMGLGSLILVYWIGADVMKRPWLGVAGVALLIILPIQTWYATGPRMYIPLQFFTLLATYAVWRGYVEGDRRYRIVALVAMVAGTLSNQEGIIVAVALTATAPIVLWARGVPWRTILSFENVATAVGLGLVTLFIATYKPPDPMPLVLGHAGVDPARVGLNLNPINWGRHVLHLERSIPYSLAFLFVGYLAFVKSARARLDMDHRWTYLFAAFTFSFVTFGLVIKAGGHRLLFFLLPLYALLVLGGVAAVVSVFTPTVSSWLRLPRGRLLVPGVLFAAGITASIGLSTLKQLSFSAVRRGDQPLGDFVVQSFKQGLNVTGLAREGYGLPCGYGWRCDHSMEEQFRRVAAHLAPSDLIVTGIPMETNYFLGRVDGWLFFRREGRSYPTLERRPTDEYFGAPIIDTSDEVRSLEASGRRVWIITDPRGIPGEDATRDAMWMAIDSAFTLFDTGPHFEVYVSSDEAIAAGATPAIGAPTPVGYTVTPGPMNGR